MKATINFEENCSQFGFTFPNAGDAWTARAVDKERLLGIKGKAYLDSRRTISVSLNHPIELKGGTGGFALSPPLVIDSVKDGRISDVGLIGYAFTDQGRQIRFVLEPGKLGFRGNDTGSAEIYISGPFNGWGNTAHGHFKPLPEWQMTWNATARRYELTAPVGDCAGRVPAEGAAFKFTVNRENGQEWYPSQNIDIKVGSAWGTDTTELVITLAEDADITTAYTLKHEELPGLALIRRGVLNDDAFVYRGNDLGHSYSPSGTKFRLWAPAASDASVAVYHTPEGGVAALTPMKPGPAGTWAAEVNGDLKGKYYTYVLQTGGQRAEAMDPYAVGAGVNGNRALIVDLRETDPAGFRTHRRPPFRHITDAIIYEIHVRDLSMNPNAGIAHRGKFLAFTETGTTSPEGVRTGVDHLKELGVTHIHLLPVFDFATVDEERNDQFNWGYDPKNFNVPEGSYATDPNGTARIREFKQMVQALHENGLRVVMDVVYNHTFAGASPFDAIAPHYYYRYDEIGRLANGSGTGNETASERPMMRKYIVDSVRFWASEYRVDGFRFDLMALHDLDTMKAVRAALDEIDPSIIVYGEPWTGGASPLDDDLRTGKGKQKGMNLAVFNDHIRNAIKGDNDGCIRGFATGAGYQTMNIQRGVVGSIAYDNWLEDFCQEPGESINYVSAHDNMTLWDKIAHSNASDSEEDRISMNLLSQAIVFTSQGVPFVHGGEELLRTKGGHHNSYNAPDSVNMLDWSRKARYRQVFEYYKGLIELRKGHPAFRLPTAEQVRRHLEFLKETPANTVAFRLKDNAGGDAWKEIVVIYNPNREPVSVNLPGGNWQVAAHGLRVGNGAVLGSAPASGSASVPPISMMVLFQP
ncbi:MAG TPA: type I pullulanase [Symbiobacteriaceae bacterium]|nr:type I pullulanase [Symbiobacteriaceae bacterium]